MSRIGKTVHFKLIYALKDKFGLLGIHKLVN